MIERKVWLDVGELARKYWIGNDVGAGNESILNPKHHRNIFALRLEARVDKRR